jgi:hypothetical protein
MRRVQDLQHLDPLLPQAAVVEDPRGSLEVGIGQERLHGSPHAQ